MSKGVIVLDKIPKVCIDCPCHFACDTGVVWCGKENKELLADDIQEHKPDWCPIKPLPKYEEDPDNYDEWENGYTDGFNVCLDMITGKTEDNIKDDN